MLSTSVQWNLARASPNNRSLSITWSTLSSLPITLRKLVEDGEEITVVGRQTTYLILVFKVCVEYNLAEARFDSCTPEMLLLSRYQHVLSVELTRLPYARDIGTLLCCRDSMIMFHAYTLSLFACPCCQFCTCALKIRSAKMTQVPLGRAPANSRQVGSHSIPLKSTPSLPRPLWRPLLSSSFCCTL